MKKGARLFFTFLTPPPPRSPAPPPQTWDSSRACPACRKGWPPPPRTRRPSGPRPPGPRHRAAGGRTPPGSLSRPSARPRRTRRSRPPGTGRPGSRHPGRERSPGGGGQRLGMVVGERGGWETVFIFCLGREVDKKAVSLQIETHVSPRPRPARSGLRSGSGGCPRHPRGRPRKWRRGRRSPGRAGCSCG